MTDAAAAGLEGAPAKLTSMRCCGTEPVVVVVVVVVVVALRIRLMLLTGRFLPTLGPGQGQSAFGGVLAAT